jgi:hypothetical protein
MVGHYAMRIHNDIRISARQLLKHIFDNLSIVIQNHLLIDNAP